MTQTPRPETIWAAILPAVAEHFPDFLHSTTGTESHEEIIQDICREVDMHEISDWYHVRECIIRINHLK